MEFLLFVVIGIIGLGWNELVLWALTGLLGWHYVLSKVGSAVLVYLWNLGARKALLFR